MAEYIEKNIDTKTKDYKQKSLQCIFMLNNHNYILRKLKQPKIRENVSDNLVKSYELKASNDIQGILKIIIYLYIEYIQATWGKVLTLFADTSKLVTEKKSDEYTKSAKNEVKKILKARYQNFKFYN